MSPADDCLFGDLFVRSEVLWNIRELRSTRVRQSHAKQVKPSIASHSTRKRYRSSYVVRSRLKACVTHDLTTFTPRQPALGAARAAPRILATLTWKSVKNGNKTAPTRSKRVDHELE